MGPNFDALQACVPLSISSHVHIVLYVLPRSLGLCTTELASYLLAPAGGRTQSPDCALRMPVSHDQRRGCQFFLLVYQVFLSLVSKSLSNTDPQLPTTKLICSNSHFGAVTLSAPMMLLRYSFASASFTPTNPSSLSVDRLNSKIYTIFEPH